MTQATTATLAAWNQWNLLTCAVPKAARVGFAKGLVPDPESTSDTYNVMPIWLTDPNAGRNHRLARRVGDQLGHTGDTVTHEDLARRQGTEH